MTQEVVTRSSRNQSRHCTSKMHAEVTQKTDEKKLDFQDMRKNTQEIQKDAGLEGQVTGADFLGTNPTEGSGH